MQMNPAFEGRSDIDLPSPWIKKLLTGIALFENRWLPMKPFGSSLFLLLKKKKSKANH
jgi:hypothetical protein